MLSTKSNSMHEQEAITTLAKEIPALLPNVNTHIFLVSEFTTAALL